MPETGTYLPIHMFPLPGAWADQNHRDVGVSYVIVPYPSPDFVQREITVDDVACVNGSVDYVALQHRDESVLVRHV